MLIECSLGVYAVRNKTRRKVHQLSCKPIQISANDQFSVIGLLRSDKMSGSDSGDGQCNRTRESNVVAMGDVLVKKQRDDVLRDACISAEDNFMRQETDWAISYMEDAVRSPVVADSVPVAVCFLLTKAVTRSPRTNNRQPRTRSTCRA